MCSALASVPAFRGVFRHETRDAALASRPATDTTRERSLLVWSFIKRPAVSLPALPTFLTVLELSAYFVSPQITSASALTRAACGAA